MTEPTINDLENIANKYNSKKAIPGDFLSIFETLLTGDLAKITDEEWQALGIPKEDLDRNKNQIRKDEV
jgi:hypothetical protein